ncbi:MAG: HAMP domain-containing sensor histidine kinase [Bacteroidota bacterium]
MFKNLKLSTRVFLILTPFLIVAFGSSVYVNYRFQEQQTLEQAGNAANAEAVIIKRSLVHMMVKNLIVDDKYLAQINEPGGDIENLQVLFHADSLHLLEDYATPQRMARLRERQASLFNLRPAQYEQAFSTGRPVWIMACDITKHPIELPKHDDYPIESFSSGIPLKFWTCGKLKVILPFRAEGRCQTCHDVPEGYVLGAASMDVPFVSTFSAIRANAVRSAGIFLVVTLVTIGVGAFFFRRLVGKPIGRLVKATEMIGGGDLNVRVSEGFDNDELGKLAVSFQHMQERLRQAQAELVKKERLSTLGQMASGIIHDFRNPISSALAAIQFLERHKDVSDDRRHEMLELVRSSVDRMLRMTQELLDFSRGEVRLELREELVGDLLAEITKDVKSNLEKRGITFAVRQEFEGKMFFDRDRLLRALINIINNAEDAMPKGGSIDLEVVSENGTLVFRIRDTAGGIPERIRDKVFEPFFTSGKAKGTGLGLAITKRIVEQHGGTIHFECEDGKGTTFFIKIPIRQELAKTA